MNTFSKKISTNLQEEFKTKILQNFDAIVNPKQYAFWEIKNKDFNAVFYNSSKFVVQGKNISKLLEVLNLEFDTCETSQNDDNYETIITDHIGTDESGKGDFFGPLVVAGVLVTDSNRRIFEDLGVRDSKTLKDDKILKMALSIQKNSISSVVIIQNPKYNELYPKFKNLNRMLAWGHASVIENILKKTDCKTALSDKFGDESLIQNALKTKGRQIELIQRVRGESDIAVAAASILARATFVNKMTSMERFYGCKFSKGCNSVVKAQALEFAKKFGKDRLTEVCKKHFKTYDEII